MPPPAPRRLRLAVAVVGYLASATACVAGMGLVLIAWATWAALTAAYLVWTGRAREIARRRWY